ncbi:MAG: hypothetical protein GY798_08795 [Hyphomicrobiales bacterium]|nr:hypothetical protein [Hyphomicrobiales bacterium]
MKPERSAANAAIVVLLVLTGVMLASLFSRTPPHPPIAIAPFALAPFLGASLAIGAAALHLVRQGARHGALIAILFALTALVSFGPQKYLAPNFVQIWPTVVTAQVAVIVLLVRSVVVLLRPLTSSARK